VCAHLHACALHVRADVDKHHSSRTQLRLTAPRVACCWNTVVLMRLIAKEETASWQHVSCCTLYVAHLCDMCFEFVARHRMMRMVCCVLYALYPPAHLSSNASPPSDAPTSTGRRSERFAALSSLHWRRGGSRCTVWATHTAYAIGANQCKRRDRSISIPNSVVA
jgi:hypothetical protein